MDPQFEELARHVADEVEKRVSKRVRGAEKRLARGTRVHMEDLKSVVTLAAEGYGATLDRIERQLTELNTKWDTKRVAAGAHRLECRAYDGNGNATLSSPVSVIK